MPKKNKYSTKKDLAKALKREAKVDLEKAKQITELYFKTIRNHLILGEQVKITEFGSFVVKDWNSKELYDVNVGKKIQKEIKTVSFKISQKAKDYIIKDS